MMYSIILNNGLDIDFTAAKTLQEANEKAKKKYSNQSYSVHLSTKDELKTAKERGWSDYALGK